MAPTHPLSQWPRSGIELPGQLKMSLDANDADDAIHDDAYENRKVSVDTADVTATDNDALW